MDAMEGLKERNYDGLLEIFWFVDDKGRAALAQSV
jgi:hypothetical protein